MGRLFTAGDKEEKHLTSLVWGIKKMVRLFSSGGPRKRERLDELQGKIRE